MEALLSPVGSIVQSHSVEVGDTDDDLEEVSGRVVCADAEDGDEAQWSPGELDDRVRCILSRGLKGRRKDLQR